ncbi:MAG: hypothetical protein LBE80_04365 [Deltaproteobacteria bacterium]|jgi:hypothetical protein|nr:hypothetical protein [Deltaproteobacteria bacterium]
MDLLPKSCLVNTMAVMVDNIKTYKIIITKYEIVTEEQLIKMYLKSVGHDYLFLVLNLVDKKCGSLLGPDVSRRKIPLNTLNRAMNKVLSAYLAAHDHRVPEDDDSRFALANEIFAAGEKVIRAANFGRF